MDDNQIKLREAYDAHKKQLDDTVDGIKAEAAEKISLARNASRENVAREVHAYVESGMTKGQASEAIRTYSNWAKFKQVFDAVPFTGKSSRKKSAPKYEVDGTIATFFEGWSGFSLDRVPPGMREDFQWPVTGFQLEFYYDDGEVSWRYADVDGINAFTFASMTELQRVGGEILA